uniref:Putative ovule protein n=1 Tax=Solanum chacoense TaxID=4108 RepID=A0A0V0HH85_SOLCH
MLLSIGSTILSSAKYIFIGVSIPSLKQAFINISVPPKCTYFTGSLALISCISLFIIRLFIIGILVFPFVYLQSIIYSF